MKEWVMIAEKGCIISCLFIRELVITNFFFAQKLSSLGIACLSINAALHTEVWKGKEKIIVRANAIYTLMKTEGERLS